MDVVLGAINRGDGCYFVSFQPAQGAGVALWIAVVTDAGQLYATRVAAVETDYVDILADTIDIQSITPALTKLIAEYKARNIKGIWNNGTR